MMEFGPRCKAGEDVIVVAIDEDQIKVEGRRWPQTAKKACLPEHATLVKLMVLAS